MTTTPHTILIMAGGTGGHIMPGLAVADVLRSRGWTVTWLGNPEKMEGRLVPARGYELAPLYFSGLRGRGLRAKLLAPFLLARAMVQAWRHFTAIRPSVVLGMGGYVSFPGGLVSALRATPLVLHEQNAIAGMANKVLARISKRVLAGFPKSIKGAEVVGNPVRQDLVTLAEPMLRYAERSGALRVLVVGGSLGATALNEILPKALADIPVAQRPIVIHQAGEQHLDSLINDYQQADVQAKCVAFIDDMADQISRADLLICRAGAMTVAEVAAAGVAALFVPYPHAVDNHQTANAEFLSGDGAAWLMQQSSLSAAGLAEWLLQRNRAELAQVAQRARLHARPFAAQRIADICEELVGVVK